MSTITKKNSLEDLLKQRETIISKFGEAYVPAKLNEEIRQLQVMPAYEKLVEEIINDLKLDKISSYEDDMTTGHLEGSNIYVRFQVKKNGICVCFGYSASGVWESALILMNKLSERTVSFEKFGYEAEAEVAYLKDRISNKMLEFLASNR